MNPPLNSPTVLVVDDDEAIVDALVLLLELEGFKPIAGVEGNLLERVASMKPAAVLLDVWLSGRDGRELCKQLKKDARTENIPVLLISASRELATSAKLAGADGYIEKPFEMETVVAELHRVIKFNS